MSSTKLKREIGSRQLYFYDVTLATVDNHQINVHNIIISSCIQFIRNILLRNLHQNPLIYLTNTRQNLQVHLPESVWVRAGGASGLPEHWKWVEDKWADGWDGKEKETYVPQREQQHLDKYQENDSHAPDLNIGDAAFEIDSNSKVEKVRKYPCDQCDIKYSYQSKLKSHKLAEHTGVRFGCGKCDVVFTQQDSLNIYTRSQYMMVNLWVWSDQIRYMVVFDMRVISVILYLWDRATWITIIRTHMKVLPWWW